MTLKHSEIQHKIDTKTKPVGALGQLETIALQIATLQQSLNPKLIAPHIIVFAGDHGIANDGVSAYPQEVTWQMVYNFIQGGAAINVFTQQHNIALKVVDAGVNYQFPIDAPLLHYKVGMGTRSFLTEAAMTPEAYALAFANGTKIVQAIKTDTGCNVIGFGEMGIANTSSASMLMHLVSGRKLEDCVGRGTGLDDAQLAHKLSVLKQAALLHGANNRRPEAMMQAVGGYEMTSMLGAMLEAKALNMLILVDGFIASAVFMVAQQMEPTLTQQAIFCHQSNESGHKFILEDLGVKPLLNLGMRLGEGTGCAVAYPIIESAVAFMNTMASFESAQISQN